MIYVTGDTHAPLNIEKLLTFENSLTRPLTRDDYVIICGDFGGIWYGAEHPNHLLRGHDAAMTLWFENRPFTTLFIDGNHENFDCLNSYRVDTWNGGCVHFIKPHVIHLMRGQVFNINGKKFFTMGGAKSIDRSVRIENITWWEAEEPNDEEYQEAFNNLRENENTVDYIITHAAPTSTMLEIDPSFIEHKINSFLQFIKEHVTYNKWFFGHYHVDRTMDDKHYAMFNNVLEV